MYPHSLLAVKIRFIKEFMPEKYWNVPMCSKENLYGHTIDFWTNQLLSTFSSSITFEMFKNNFECNLKIGDEFSVKDDLNTYIVKEMVGNKIIAKKKKETTHDFKSQKQKNLFILQALSTAGKKTQEDLEFYYDSVNKINGIETKVTWIKKK